MLIKAILTFENPFGWEDAYLRCIYVDVKQHCIGWIYDDRAEKDIVDDLIIDEMIWWIITWWRDMGELLEPSSTLFWGKKKASTGFGYSVFVK